MPHRAGRDEGVERLETHSRLRDSVVRFARWPMAGEREDEVSEGHARTFLTDLKHPFTPQKNNDQAISRPSTPHTRLMAHTQAPRYPMH